MAQLSTLGHLHFMKNVIITVIMAATIMIAGCGKQSDLSDTSSPAWQTGAQGSSYASVKLKVLKVYSAKDGDMIFRSYVARWNGQEVIISDVLVKSDNHVGDTISVLVMKQVYPGKSQEYGLLSFQIQ